MSGGTWTADVCGPRPPFYAEAARVQGLAHPSRDLSLCEALLPVKLMHLHRARCTTQSASGHQFRPSD